MFGVQIDALAEAIRAFEGGVVLVSHDSRLIEQAECRLWVCENYGCYEFDGDLEDYRDRIMTVRTLLLAALWCSSHALCCLRFTLCMWQLL